jgi:two-component system chemotaxis response regulator CheB
MIVSHPIRVLAVDESAAFRKFLADILGKRSDIHFVGSAHDAYDARDRMRVLPVDVMTIDLDLPRMGGLSFLRLVMERKPMPVIVLSAKMPTGSRKAIEALIAGAVAVIEKPKKPADRSGFTQNLIRSIKTAATAPKRRKTSVLKRILPETSVPISAYHARQIIALGASTGGTQALESVLKSLSDSLPGIVVVQHIPAGFSANFAARLNAECAMEVREAQQGDVVRPGLALIAPGNRHMEVQWVQTHYRIALRDGPKIEHQRPSVDVLFKSLAQSAGKHAVAVLLTGMGQDGAAGMKALHDLRARTIAQDAISSVVYGMARRAVELKAVDAVVSLEHLAARIMKALESHRTPLAAHA